MLFLCAQHHQGHDLLCISLFCAAFYRNGAFKLCGFLCQEPCRSCMKTELHPELCKKTVSCSVPPVVTSYSLCSAASEIYVRHCFYSTIEYSQSACILLFSNFPNRLAKPQYIGRGKRTIRQSPYPQGLCQRRICSKFSADADPRAAFMTIFDRHLDHPKHCRMMGIINGIKALVLTGRSPKCTASGRLYRY